MTRAPPPIAPARGPPGTARSVVAELDFDQTPAFDPSNPEPAPDFYRRQATFLRGGLATARRPVAHRSGQPS